MNYMKLRSNPFITGTERDELDIPAPPNGCAEHSVMKVVRVQTALLALKNNQIKFAAAAHVKGSNSTGSSREQAIRYRWGDPADSYNSQDLHLIDEVCSNAFDENWYYYHASR